MKTSAFLALGKGCAEIKGRTIYAKFYGTYFVSYSYNKSWNTNMLVVACAGFSDFSVAVSATFFPVDEYLLYYRKPKYNYKFDHQMFSLNSNIKNIELWPLILSLFQVKKMVYLQLFPFSLTDLII